jgi:hypothetical protein
MTNIDGRLRRIEAASAEKQTALRAVRGFSLEEADAAEAELRASGFTGRVLRIVRTMVDPPVRTD